MEEDATDYVLSARLHLAPDASIQLQHTIETSFDRLIGCTRPSAWRPFAGMRCLEVSGAQFVANFLQHERYPNTAYLCFENLHVEMRSRLGTRDTAPKGRFLRAAQRYALLFGKPAADAVRKAAPTELTLSVGAWDGEVASVQWTAAASLDRCWIRIDTDAGTLSMAQGKEQTVLHAGAPRAGAAVRCYAISPDGDTWYAVERRITPTQP